MERRLNLNENGIDDDGEVVDVQHARRSNEEEKRDGKRMVQR